MISTNPQGPYPIAAVWTVAPLAVPSDASANRYLDRPAYLQDRANGSVYNKPVVFWDTDSCGFTNYKKGYVSANLTGSNADCETFSTFSGTLKITVPSDATGQEIADFVDTLQEQLTGALLALTDGGNIQPN